MNDYELWSWRTRDELSRVLRPDEQAWQFHGYRRLTLREVLRYEDFGYCVRRVIGERSETIPLFPLLNRGRARPVLP